jgi:lysophospholipase L1-like esterase
MHQQALGAGIPACILMFHRIVLAFILCVFAVPSMVAAAPVGPIEAELSTKSASFLVSSEHPGFTGIGYVDYVGEGYVEWTVDEATGGTYALIWRYALGGGNRPLRITVDGVIVSSSLDFPATGSWDSWGEVQVPVTLSPGTHTIRAQSIGLSGPNVDHLRLEVQSAPPSDFVLLCSADSTVNGDDPDCPGGTFPGGSWVYLWPETDVSSVDFYLDGVFHRTERLAPYELDGGAVTNLSPGSHTVRAVVHLADGATQDIAATFTVGAAPSSYSLLCSGDAIVNGADPGCAGGTFTDGLWVYLWPESGVSSVDFYLDGVFHRTEGLAPYELDGGAVAGLSAGSHTVRAVVHLADGTTQDVVATFTADTTPSGIMLLTDAFDDGDALGWAVVDNCIKNSQDWLVLGNVYKQVGKCNGVSPQGAVVGSYALSNVPLSGNVDIQLRVRSEDPALDGVTSNDDSTWKFGAIGVLFGYQNANTYYRFEMNARKGYRKLWRRQGGVFTELNTSPQSYVGGQWMGLRIIHQNGVILVFIDGRQVLAAQDAAFASGRMALFCSGNSSCSFDDIVVRSAPAVPMLGLSLPDGGAPGHAAGEYFVDTDGDLAVSGFSTLASGLGGIQFVVDEGSVGEVSQTDVTAPYSAQFNGLLTGDHTVTGYLLDTSLTRLATPQAAVSLPQVGSTGIHLYCLGDSITMGLFDDVVLDDVSLNGRNTGGGYAPVLNDHLSASNTGVPVTVWNDGNSGETTAEGVGRIAAIVTRTPQVQGYLFGYGTNDSGGSLPLPSGLGLNPGDPGYAGSYKDYLQRVIDAVVRPPPLGAGKRVYFAKVPPFLSNATRDARVQEFNQVIEELLGQLKLAYPDYLSYVAPDFHGYFTAHPGEFVSDGIHPSGIGYQSMGRLWCEALNGQQGWNCLAGP